MASSVSEVLVPLKFLLVMLQLILVIMILATKVRAPTPPLSLSHSLIAQDEYILAELGPLLHLLGRLLRQEHPVGAPSPSLSAGWLAGWLAG